MIEQKSIHRNISIISIILIVSYFFYLFNKRFLTLQLLNDYKIWNHTTLEYFMPIILLPIGIFCLYRYKKIGWIITNGLLMYFVSTATYQMILEFKWGVLKSGTEKHDMIFNSFQSGSGILLYIIQVTVLSAILIYLNTNKIKITYHINTQFQITTLLLPIVVAILYALIY